MHSSIFFLSGIINNGVKPLKIYFLFLQYLLSKYIASFISGIVGDIFILFTILCGSGICWSFLNGPKYWRGVHISPYLIMINCLHDNIAFWRVSDLILKENNKGKSILHSSKKKNKN